MKTFTTSLPISNHDGESTAEAIFRVAATLRAGGVAYTMTPGCTGFWYEGDDLYRDDVVLVEMRGDEAVMRRALARYGEDAQQYEVLFVERTSDWIAARAEGEAGAAALAKEHGGATLTPSGSAFSVAHYRALVHGRDYVSTVTGEVVK